MPIRHLCLLVLGLGVCLSAPSARGDDQLNQQARGLFNQYCFRCHGGDDRQGNAQFVILDRDVLVAPRGPGEMPYVTPGAPEQSYIWTRMRDGSDMPPSDEPQPTPAERALIQQWIASGAAFPTRVQRPFIEEIGLLTVMRDYVRGLPEPDRRFTRFFTMTHLFNNYQRIDDKTLTLCRASLSKAINSLSWEPTIVPPVQVDPEGTIYAIDLRDLGWDRKGVWGDILKRYPYGLKYNHHTDARLRDVARELSDLTGAELPYMRADWVVAKCTRPPLYHTILDLPDTAEELEKQLRVDVANDFMRDRIVRAAFMESGISGQNRLVDRHSQVHGAYWKSYDFLTNQGRGNLLTHPLGPMFEGNPHNQQAFEHDGGEIIFTLPNGLQGYLLVDGKGKRIDVGPIQVVADRLKTSGTVEIVNGLSCMACHRHGMIRFQDVVREGAGVQGQALVKMQNLFPTQDRLDRIVQGDEARFVQAAEQAMAPFLKGSELEAVPFRDLQEPIGEMARWYHKDLTANEVALELGLDPAAFPIVLKTNPRLRAKGLGALINGGVLKREIWESLDGFLSLQQQVASELDLGTPHRQF